MCKEEVSSLNYCAIFRCSWCNNALDIGFYPMGKFILFFGKWNKKEIPLCENRSCVAWKDKEKTSFQHQYVGLCCGACQRRNKTFRNVDEWIDEHNYSYLKKQNLKFHHL